MSITVSVSGLPPHVIRTQVLHAINSLGINPEGLKDLEFRHDVIYASVFAADERGNHYAEAHGYDDGTFNAHPNGVAVHRLAIPIIDKEPE